MVFKNGMIMVEGIDYQVSNGNIISLVGLWNASSISDYEMYFVVLKEILLYDPSTMTEVQLKTDNALNTNAKTVTTAINELKTQIDTLNAQLVNMTNQVATLTAQVDSQAVTIAEQLDQLEEQRLQSIAAANSLLDEL